MNERRLHERYAIPVSLYRESDGSTDSFTTRNVSLGGAYVLTNQPEPVGTRLVMFLNLPREGRLEISPGTEIEVVRHGADGMGVRFVDPPQEFLDHLKLEFKRQFTRRAATGGTL